jgi:hypothetical protein
MLHQLAGEENAIGDLNKDKNSKGKLKFSKRCVLLMMISRSHYQLKHSLFAYCIDSLSLDVQTDDGH